MYRFFLSKHTFSTHLGKYQAAQLLSLMIILIFAQFYGGMI